MKCNLRAGLIGLGVMGSNHSRILSSLSGVDFVGIVEPNVTSSINNQGRPVFKTVEELLNLKIDYAIVATPTTDHLSVGLKLAASGIHALIEKPLALDAESSRLLVDTFEKAGLIGAVGHIERFNPAFIEARSRLEILGPILQISTRRQGSGSSRVTDIGVVKDLATHDIDITSWLLNSRYKCISAQIIRQKNSIHEDLLAATGRLSNNTIVNHLVNWVSPYKERITVLSGENGAFMINSLTADLTFHRFGRQSNNWKEISQFRGLSEGEVIRYELLKTEPLKVEHENFRDVILGKSAEIVTFIEGSENIKVAEAIHLSDRLNQVVPI